MFSQRATPSPQPCSSRMTPPAGGTAVAVAVTEGVETDDVAVATGGAVALGIALASGKAVAEAVAGGTLDVGTAPLEHAASINTASNVVARNRRILVTFRKSAHDVGAYSSDDPARRRVGVKFAPTHEMSRSSG